MVEVEDGSFGRDNAPDWLRVELRTFGRICRLILSGSLSGTSIAALEAQVDQLGCAPFDAVVIDVRRLTALDAVGARVLFGLYHYVEAKGGQLRIVGATKQVASTLRRFRTGTQVPSSVLEPEETAVIETVLMPVPPMKANEVAALPASYISGRVTASRHVPVRTAGRPRRRWQMSDDNLGEVSEATRKAEEEEASAPHMADRAATPEEEADAESQSLEKGVAEHYEEMAERGANQKGEGRIS
jgi:anti-anti-sigma factor